MRRAVALAAAVAVFSGVGLAGCQGRPSVGERADRASQIGDRAGSGTGTGAPNGSGQASDGSIDADLDAVDALLADVDAQLAEDSRAPEDAD
ncbi:MAG: hypothetical protein L0Y54_12225 [Sporichthyaceae bacterium]|nr:hypothetical protein [Sporichthyaceae bacterium]